MRSYLLVFVAFSVLYLSLSVPLPLWPFILHSSSPLLQFGDQVRQVHLYTDNKHRSYFVEILSNGTVSGNPNRTPHTVLELRAVKPGHTVIRGVTSSLYLCINTKGQLIALSVFLDADCSFSEFLQTDGYTHFLSAHHKLPVSLNVNDPFERSFSRFLPLRTEMITNSEEEEKRENPEPSSFLTDPDLDSDDPFRITDQNPWSPAFHTDR